MKIGIMADSHDHLSRIRRALHLLRAHGVEELIHAGDVVAPFAAKAVTAFEGPIHCVFGNNDGERKGLSKVLDVKEPPLVLEIGGRKIIVAHEVAEVPDGLARDADAVIVGHTHEPEVKPGKPVWINPGETGGWLTDCATCAVLDLETMEVEICEIPTTGSFKSLAP